MSQIKISQLPQLPSISSNTSNSLFLGVDLPSGITGKFTATTLAQQLYANNYLTVGNNQIVFPNTVAQFSGYDPNFLQINMQNFTSSGSGDYIVTADIGTQTTGYIDVGIQGSTNYDSANASAYYPLDGYLYVQGGAATQGGNLIVGTGTTGTHIKFTIGGSNNSNTVAHMYSNGTATFANNVIFGGNLIFSDGTTQNSSSYSAGIYANTAFQYANSAGSYANSSYLAQNTTGVYANTAFQYANSAGSYANSAYLSQNTTGVYANTAFQYANSAGSYANSAYNFANTANAYLYGVNAVQNTNISIVSTYANGAYQYANSAGSYANSAYLSQNTTGVYANGAYQYANSAGSYANSAYNFANTANAYLYGVNAVQNTNIISVGNQVNFAYNQANLANSIANTALQNTSTITVNNSIVIPGNITIYGTETRYGNTVTYGNTTWNGALTANNNFTANGIVTFNANTTFNGNTTHNGNTIFVGGITSYGPRISNGDSFFNGNVTANGITTLNGNTFVTGNTTFTGPLTNNGNTYNNGTTYNNGITYLSGTILPTSNTISLGSPSAPFQNIYLSNSTILFTNANATITGTLTVGTIFITNNSIYSSNTQQDINFGQLAATANINMNRVTVFNKDVYENGNVWANSTSITANTLYSNTFVYGSGSASPVVTQTTSRTTAVTANGISGQIIGYAASALTHQTGYVFTVNNNQVLHASDIVVVSVQSSNCPLPQICVANTRVGSFDIAVYNAAGGGNDAAYTMNLNFAVIRVGS